MRLAHTCRPEYKEGIECLAFRVVCDCFADRACYFIGIASAIVLESIIRIQLRIYILSHHRLEGVGRGCLRGYYGCGIRAADIDLRLRVVAHCIIVEKERYIAKHFLECTYDQVAEAFFKLLGKIG